MGRENAVYEKFRKDYPVLKEQPVWEAFELLLKSCRNGGKILVCGNGGSASDSEHIVGELMKGFLLKRELPDEEKEKFRRVMRSIRRPPGRMRPPGFANTSAFTTHSVSAGASAALRRKSLL